MKTGLFRCAVVWYSQNMGVPVAITPLMLVKDMLSAQ